MRNLLMIGMILLIAGCEGTSKSEGYFVNLDSSSAAYNQVRHGQVNFDYTIEDRDKVLSWVNSASVTTAPISEIKEQLFCVKMDYFFKTIKPNALKYHDEYWNGED